MSAEPAAHGGRAVWDLSSAVLGRRAALRLGATALGAALAAGVLSACGRGEGDPSVEGTRRAATDAARAVAIEAFVLGRWRIFAWDGAAGEIPEEAADLAVSSVFALPRVLGLDDGVAEGHLFWTYGAEITATTFALSSLRNARRSDVGDYAGRWSYGARGITINCDDDTADALDAADPILAAALPLQIGPGPLDPGKLTWAYDSEPDLVSYAQRDGVIHLFIGFDDSFGWNYLAQRA